MDLYRPANPRSRGAAHYRRPGTTASYCGRTVEAEPMTAMYFDGVCKRCAKAEQRDRVAAEQTAADRAIGGPTLAERAGVRYCLVGKGRRVHYSNNDDTLCGREVSEYTDGPDDQHDMLCARCIQAAEERAYARSLAAASPLAAAAVKFAETVEEADGARAAALDALAAEVAVRSAEVDAVIPPAVEAEQQVPAVHRFHSTGEAYDATQCRDDIRNGDVLIIEREGVVGFLRTAWPAAITAEHGELHAIDGDPRTLDDGRYVASVEAAEQVAREHGFTLAAEQRLDAVEAEVAEQVRIADAVAHAEQVEAGVKTLANTEALHATQLVTEADATDGTWRGEWIGQQPGDALFALELPAEQGALFDDRAAAEVEVEVEVRVADLDGEPPF